MQFLGLWKLNGDAKKAVEIWQRWRSLPIAPDQCFSPTFKESARLLVRRAMPYPTSVYRIVLPYAVPE